MPIELDDLPAQVWRLKSGSHPAARPSGGGERSLDEAAGLLGQRCRDSGRVLGQQVVDHLAVASLDLRP